VTAPSGLIIVDKPSGWTSHDVVARIRRLAGTRRIGHAGTLDPMATGVLVIGVEKATRLLGHLALTEKDYAATIRLGATTDTDDADGEILATAPASGVSRSALDTAVAALTGEIRQVPPGVSAIKVRGQRAYRLTRAGAAPELAARTVTVSKLTVGAVRAAGDYLDTDVEVTCSSGTYIRALARDLGAALGVGGHLTALRRTRVGPYEIGAASTLEQLAADLRIVPLAAAAAAAFPRRDLTEEETRLLSHGARLPWADASAAPAGAGMAGAGTAGAEMAGAGTAGAEMAGAGMAGAGMAGAGMAGAEMAGAGMAGAETAGAGTAGGGTGEDEAGPVAAFAPDGRLIALLGLEQGQARPLAVFVP
jgi:tRNA pseudouridine55 synthase